MVMVSAFGRKINVRSNDLVRSPFGGLKYMGLLKQRGIAGGPVLTVGFDRVAGMRFRDAGLSPMDRVDAFYKSEAAQSRLIDEIDGVKLTRVVIEQLAGGRINLLQMLGGVKEGVKVNIFRDAGAHSGAAWANTLDRDDYYNVVMGVRNTRFINHLVGREKLTANAQGIVIDFSPFEIDKILEHTGLSVPNREVGVKLVGQIHKLLSELRLEGIYVREENNQSGIVYTNGHYQELHGDHVITNAGVVLLDLTQSIDRWPGR